MFDRVIFIIGTLCFSAFTIASIVRGRTIFGGPPALVIHRATKPVRYWIIVGVSLGLSIMFGLLVIAELRRTPE